MRTIARLSPSLHNARQWGAPRSTTSTDKGKAVMPIDPARATKCIIIAAVVACVALLAACIDFHNQAMTTCLVRHTFDTCHSALNR